LEANGKHIFAACDLHRIDPRATAVLPRYQLSHPLVFKYAKLLFLRFILCLDLGSDREGARFRSQDQTCTEGADGANARRFVLKRALDVLNDLVVENNVDLGL